MIRLPAAFVPTHETAGLPGYPAIDVFGRPNESVAAPVSGTVHRLSGHDPAQGGTPGGAYGWSIYLRAANGDDYYMTHFGSRSVKLGQKVKAGQVIGTICDSRVSGKPGTSHIHMGCDRAELVYDVRGPKGRRYVEGKPAAVVNEKWPSIVRRVGRVEIIAVDTEL